MINAFKSIAWRLFCALAFAIAPLAAFPESAKAQSDTLWVYIGTYTKGGSQGIYRLDFDLKSGKLSTPSLAAKTVNPSFLAIHPNRRFLYAVNEVQEYQQQKSGAISAFAIDQKTGELTFLNQESSSGTDPCHLTVDRKGRHVLAANYSSGSACVLALQEDGRLGSRTAFAQHRGFGPNKQRQEGPHAHSINLDAANRFASVADLGLDHIFSYKYDEEKGTLTPNTPQSVALPPGSGPRHFTFHPDGKHAYAINELGSTITAFDYDAKDGVLTAMQTITSLPKGFEGENSTADIHVHPSGRFLYGSNRDRGNSIAIFAINRQTGKLTPTGHETHLIRTPRNFNIDPTGAYLLAASQSSGRVIAFRINPENGALTPTGSVTQVPLPVCVQFMAKPAS